MSNGNTVASIDVTFENLATLDTEFGSVYRVEDNHVLYATTATWESQTELVTKAGYLYIYSDYRQDEQNNNIASVKVGDGTSLLSALPFADKLLYLHTTDTVIHITQAERELWNKSANALHWLGVTTTALTDGASTNPIIIEDESVTAIDGDIVSYNSKEFVFNGSVWQELGDLSDVYTKSQVDTLLADKMDKNNPTGTGSLSINRLPGSSVGPNSVAIGYLCTSSGFSAIAEGGFTKAKGSYSHAEGSYTEAASESQHVGGKYNIVDQSNTYAEIIGNGTSAKAPSNARTLDWDGNEMIAGDLTYNGSTSLTSAISDVNTRIDNLPEPMIFKGSLGTGGTITSLPVDGSADRGWTYKVIEAGTYAGQSADIGDTFICDSKTSSANTWTLIPSGDEPSGTVTSIQIQATSPISINDSTAITTSGSRTISHANSGATAGNYGDSSAQTPAVGGTFKVPYISVNATGHVTNINAHTVKMPVPTATNVTYDNANSDLSATTAQGAIDELDEKKVDNFETTVSGSIANFNTSVALPLLALKASIVATESGSGTKSPSNPYTLGGFSNAVITKAKKNLFNDAIYTEAGWTLQENGYYNGNAQALMINSRYAYTKGGIKTSGIVTISFDLLRSSGAMQIYCLYEGNSAWTNLSGNINTEGHKTVTTESNKNCIAVGLWTTVGVSSAAFSLKNFQIEISASETAYEPYTATAITLALGQTVYGGEIVLTKKASGYGVKLRVIKGEIDLSQISMSYQTSYKRFAYTISDIVISTSRSITGMSAEQYEGDTTANAGSENKFFVNNGVLYIYTTDSTANPQGKFVYPLATPIEIDLTDASDIVALVGVNNVWSDTGDIEVEYISNVIPATEVTYDNTTSGLTATNTQSAIDELSTSVNTALGVWLTGTLTAGQTTFTLSDTSITTDSIVDNVYVPDTFFGVNPTSISATTGSVTLTFPVQSSDLPVKVRVF